MANARADSHSAVKCSGISDPPEVSDWAGVRPTRAIFNSADDAAKLIKRMAHELGANIVRIAKLNPAWVYLSNPNKTRGFEANVPIEVPVWWEYAIILTGTHNFKPMYSDPNYGTSWDGYNLSSQTAQQLTYFIKRMGYPARWHSPFGGYDLCVPPISQEAGMGQVGRSSFTITPEFGGSFRPAVITTSLPMTIDKPLDFNLAKFCSRCKLCAEVCPTEAIGYTDEPYFEVRGTRRWYINYLKCRDGWNLVSGPMGCRACVGICPWTRVNNWVHRFAREVLSRDPTGITQNIAIWSEKNIYGPKNMSESLLPPDFKGVMEPPEWLVTDNYISGFTDTPMGVK
ncbi:3-chloro-4-hydroxyphenylacetate reductive dehalogenase [subsurface metagenome]